MKAMGWLLLLPLGLWSCTPVGAGPDGGTQAGGGGGGGGGGAGGGSAADGGASFAPEWVSLDAGVTGRTGRDLTLALKGKDRNKDIVSAWVKLMDGLGGPVVALDGNHDGQPDSSEGLVALEGQKWTVETLSAVAPVRGVLSGGAIVAQVGVQLVDATGLRSAEQVVPVNQQPVMSLGEACDPAFIANRCEPGFGCRGTPPRCAEGLAPTIARLAFFKGEGATSILIEGTEPEDDLANLHFAFRNAQGQDIAIDTDGDQNPDLSHFDHEATGLAVDGAFFLRLSAAAGLDLQVARLVVTPTDLAGHEGTAKVVTPTVVPVRGSGQSCDPRGFDVCGAGLSCTPGVVGASNRCSSAAPLRASQCAAATVLVPTSTGAVAYGVAEGGSLWDAPDGCSSANPTGRPEGLVTVRLLDRATRLTLTTAGPGTGFDTTLYVLPGCADDVADALGCSDDTPGAGTSSRLELTDLPAGDYVVVVDSFDPAGGLFELHAAVE